MVELKEKRFTLVPRAVTVPPMGLLSDFQYLIFYLVMLMCMKRVLTLRVKYLKNEMLRYKMMVLDMITRKYSF